MENVNKDETKELRYSFPTACQQNESELNTSEKSLPLIFQSDIGFLSPQKTSTKCESNSVVNFIQSKKIVNESDELGDSLHNEESSELECDTSTSVVDARKTAKEHSIQRLSKLLKEAEILRKFLARNGQDWNTSETVGEVYTPLLEEAPAKDINFNFNELNEKVKDLWNKILLDIEDYIRKTQEFLRLYSHNSEKIPVEHLEVYFKYVTEIQEKNILNS